MIGPCLANFTLNGLDKVCYPTQKTAFDEEKSKFLAKHYKEYYKPGQSVVRKQLVQRAYRYADDIVIISNDENQVSLVQKRVESWLSKRGLRLIPEKCSAIKWQDNTKFNFLGFTFHYILNPFQSKVTEQRGSSSKELKMRGGLYVYPSSESVNNFKNKIRSCITANLNNVPYRLVSTLNPIIRG